jgi:hypothetical protein
VGCFAFYEWAQVPVDEYTYRSPFTFHRERYKTSASVMLPGYYDMMNCCDTWETS